MTSRLALALALTSSTASWSALTYGAISMTTGRRKIAVTTPTSVKSGTTITVKVSFANPPPSTSDMIFVCPEVVLT